MSDDARDPQLTALIAALRAGPHNAPLRGLVLLVGLYLAYRVLDIALRTQGLEAWSPYLTGAWLAFCAYTWFAPALFQRSLRRELESVRLRPDY